jgi:pimeloyl-ACP methyl ester carboxylesterase
VSAPGRPLLLLHGTNSSRVIWKALLDELATQREVIAVDLPAHGQSPAASFTPPMWASDVAALIDALDLDSPAVVGHSSGGWTALELAKLRRTGSILALAPAGLWRDHSPRITDAILAVNWHLGQLLGERATMPLRSRAGRRLALRQISGDPANVPAPVAIATAQTVLDSKHFPEHFRQTRRLRFQGGEQVPASIPVRIVWGEKDRIARAGSRRTEQLPIHARVETWSGCGHMLMWDAPERVIDAALALQDETETVAAHRGRNE